MTIVSVHCVAMAWADLVIVLYLGTLGCLAIFGFHRSHLIQLYFRNRKERPAPQARFSDKPVVTVQLPLFNEKYVAERLLEAVAHIRYPRDRFQVQVLDDSTDDTQDICIRKVLELQARYPELDIDYIHRTDRTGFKAGALDNGMRTARGELIAIYDADFLPQPDVLERIVDHFTDPKVAVVQCRWEHLNRNFSALTETQAVMLDGHFIMEHGGRARSGRFFNFNGTAGMWRRSAIASAGGWQHDTLTEDMDLSYRAQLEGWRFVYVPEVATPAELPTDMAAFKSQQFRWAKGSVQVARKLLPRILRSQATFGQKAEAAFHLCNNFAYPLLIVLSLLLLPNLALRTSHGIREVMLIDLPLFFGTTLSIASFYTLSQREIAHLEGSSASRRMWQAFLRLPLVLSLGVGLSVNQSRAVFEALLGRETEFVRTPKSGAEGATGSRGKSYRAARSLMPLIEVALFLYFVVTMVVAWEHEHYVSMPFLTLFLMGYGYVGLSTVAGGALGHWARRIPEMVRQLITLGGRLGQGV